MELRKQAPTITAVCLTVLTALAIGGALYLLRPVLVPFVLAVFLSICAAPIVDFLGARTRLPQSLSIVLTLLLGLAIMVAISVIAVSAISELQADQDIYEQQLDTLLDNVVDPLLHRMGLDDARASLRAFVYEGRLPALLASLLNELLSIVSNGVIVLIYLFFLLSSQSTAEPNTESTWYQIRTSIAQYITLKVFLSLLTSVLVFATLEFFGVPLALVFGLMTFALNFIPNVGSLIAIVLPLPVILMNQELGLTAKILAFTIPSAIQFTVGYVVEPRLMGKSLDLHPVVILLGLIIWGMLWGIVGVLLAVPMTSAIKIVLEKMGYTRPIAELLAGRAPPPRPTS